MTARPAREDLTAYFTPPAPRRRPVTREQITAATARFLAGGGSIEKLVPDATTEFSRRFARDAIAALEQELGGVSIRRVVNRDWSKPLSPDARQVLNTLRECVSATTTELSLRLNWPLSKTAPLVGGLAHRRLIYRDENDRPWRIDENAVALFLPNDGMP